MKAPGKIPSTSRRTFARVFGPCKPTIDGKTKVCGRAKGCLPSGRHGTCDSRGVGGVGALVNTHLAVNIDSYESLRTRIGRLWIWRGSTEKTILPLRSSSEIFTPRLASEEPLKSFASGFTE
uniref:Uncharacterized protein n=1 Tax=Haemonchus contortus TaxID=6289 RepID=A0A7I5E6G9_HAECO